MNRKKLILFILLIVLMLALLWSYFNWPRPKTVSVLKYAPGTRAQADKKREPAVPLPSSLVESRTLRLDLLNREQATFTGYQRNIFRPVFVNEFKEMQKKSAAIRPALPTTKQPAFQPVREQPAVQPILVPESPQQELARFTFLGFMSKDDVKTIFLVKEKEKDKDRDILLVKKGDSFGGGRYQAIALTDQALTILVTDTGDEIVIPLIENKALIAAQK